MRTRTRNTVQDDTAVSLFTTRQTIDSSSGAPITGPSALHGVLANPTVISNRGYNLHYSYYGRIGVDESMTDEPSGLGAYNEVTHTKKVWNCPKVTMTYKGRSDEHSSGNTQEATSARICSVGPGTLLGPWTYTFPSNWDSDANAVARATNGLQFGVQSAGFNLPVFLGELREFRDVFGGVLGGFKPSNLDAGGVWYKKTERFLRRLERRPFAEAIKLVAGSDLFVQFAIKPMVGDIQKMLVTGQHIGSQYDRLRSNKPLRTRHTVKDSGSSFYTNLPTTSEHYYTRKVHYDRWVTAWAKFELDLSGLPEIPEWLLFADALGFDEPIHAVWELIPFSFVMDYFVKVGEFLDNFQSGFVQPPYTIIEDGYSVKRVAHVQMKRVFENPASSTAGKYANHEGVTSVEGEYTESSYKRRKGPLPYGQITYPRVTIPGFRQVRNLVSLFAARAAR